MEHDCEPRQEQAEGIDVLDGCEQQPQVTAAPRGAAAECTGNLNIATCENTEAGPDTGVDPHAELPETPPCNPEAACAPLVPATCSAIVAQPTKKLKVKVKPGPKACNTKNNLKKSVGKICISTARARAAEERIAQAEGLAAEWVAITEDEEAGVIASNHAQCLRADWQERVGALSAYQQGRCHKRVERALEVWLLDPDLPRRLDAQWMQAVAEPQHVRPCQRSASGS